MSYYFQTIGALALIMLLIIGCNPQQKVDNTAMARAAITAANEQWTAAFNKGDAAGVAANYTEDAQILPPNSEIVSGRTAIQGVFQGFIDAGLKVTLEAKEVEGHGDIAFGPGKLIKLVCIHELMERIKGFYEPEPPSCSFVK